jgi:hypothetical protein
MAKGRGSTLSDSKRYGPVFERSNRTQNADISERSSSVDPRSLPQFPHFITMQELHRYSSRKGVPTYPHGCTIRDIHGTIEHACATPGTGVCLAALLVTRLNSRGTKLVALRATPARYFSDTILWTILEWVESDGLMALAIFHFDDPEQFSDGSWVMHHAQGYRQRGSFAFPEWASCGISWDVTQMEHLKVMFCVVEHMLRMTRWPPILSMTVRGDKPGDQDTLQEYVITMEETDS